MLIGCCLIGKRGIADDVDVFLDFDTPVGIDRDRSVGVGDVSALVPRGAEERCNLAQQAFGRGDCSRF